MYVKAGLEKVYILIAYIILIYINYLVSLICGIKYFELLRRLSLPTSHPLKKVTSLKSILTFSVGH